MSWSTKIILSFAGFIGVIFTMAYISMNQDIGLVSKNYYEQEIAYQDQIDRIKNQKNLKVRPEFTVDREHAKARLVFPEALKATVSEGNLHFFRPSDARHDRHVPIRLGATGEQVIDLGEMIAGFWKVKITWTMNGDEFYDEINMIL